MPVLNWVGKQAVINHHNDIPFRFLKKNKSLSSGDTENLLIEGDNLEALKSLMPYYKGKIKCIYIDPPYNTGNEKWIYNDNVNASIMKKWFKKVVGKQNEDLSRHDKWLCMMYPRLRILHELLSDDGLIVIHIDENEQATLHILMSEIFLETNNLGTVIWNKKNPKGDSQGISYQHEEILIFAKNKKIFLAEHDLRRLKPNAPQILKKAKKIFSSLDRVKVPDDIAKIIKKYNIPKSCGKKYSKKITLDDVNNEFETWIKKQNFSGGEKAYSHISKEGRVYQTVSMAWPNKKKAPKEYFIPLIHPITKKNCPLPKRGWRYSLKGMTSLLEQDLIQFGVDETTQPRQKYFLDENMDENIPSLLNFGGSDDKLLSNLNIVFENPKPVEFSIMLLDCFLKKDGIVLDSFAGSGTTAHAVMELNKEDKGNRKFILIEMESKIAKKITSKRITNVIKSIGGGVRKKLDMHTVLLAMNYLIKMAT